MFEGFTDRARHSVVVAQREAVGFGHDGTDTAHLLLGLLDPPEDAVAEALRVAGLGDLAAARRLVVSTVGSEGPSPDAHIPFTRQVTGVLGHAASESRRLGQDHVGTAHLLWGLLQSGDDDTAVRTLTVAGVDLDRLGDEVRRLVDESRGG